jgi:molybdopterin molybdotransferase
MIEVDEALRLVLAATPVLGSETIPLAQALDRTLAAPACAAHALPSFTQSAVDGYAVAHRDIVETPCTLPLVHHIAAMPRDAAATLAPGTAARILTGGLLPQDADTVVRQERTRRDGERIHILEPVARGTDVRKAGEEMAAGREIAAAGSLLTPGLIGALAVAGLVRVSVMRRPRVVVLVTGDEVAPHGTPLRLGQVPDANGPLVCAWLQRWGIAAERFIHLPDDPEVVRAELDRALTDADLVLTTGGVSVGDHDYIPATAEALGADRVLWKVAQKPGMPLFVARRGGALLFGLPGNPASVMVNLMVYVRAALDAMCGLSPASRWRPALAPHDLKRETQKTFWLRAVLDYREDGRALLRPLRGQGSHMLGNLAKANALARVPSLEEATDAHTLLWTPIG